MQRADAERLLMGRNVAKVEDQIPLIEELTFVAIAQSGLPAIGPVLGVPFPIRLMQLPVAPFAHCLP